MLAEKKKKAVVSEAIKVLDRLYPEALCSLDYDTPFQLLVAARLSAMCTDARVNIVTRELFSKYPTPEAFLTASEDEVEAIIHPCGLGHTKAKSILGMAKGVAELGGNIPDTMEGLLLLPGVGRKIANLILGDIFNKPGVVTDTHCIRIAGRLGLTGSTVPLKVERDLEAIIPKELTSRFCHQIVHFGREWCVARSPRCKECPLAGCCEYCLKNVKGVKADA